MFDWYPTGKKEDGIFMWYRISLTISLSKSQKARGANFSTHNSSAYSSIIDKVDSSLKIQ
jgi:hypothetical protein